MILLSFDELPYLKDSESIQNTIQALQEAVQKLDGETGELSSIELKGNILSFQIPITIPVFPYHLWNRED